MKPSFMTEARMQEGIARLLEAPRDLVVCGARWIEHSTSQTQASDAHRKLYSKYRKELKKVLADAVEWWDGRTEVLMNELGSAKQARMANWREFPAGPVSDPYAVAVLRKYWLACDAINAKVEASLRVAPEVMLLKWIVDESDMETAEILSGMPYWPIGLDGSGNWL